MPPGVSQRIRRLPLRRNTHEDHADNMRVGMIFTTQCKKLFLENMVEEKLMNVNKLPSDNA
jgi:hypothetical protein